MKSLATTFVLILFFGLRAPSAFGVAAGIAGTAGLVPGLGHVIQGEPLEGLGWFVTAVGLSASGAPLARQAGFNLWMYNMYDAYRDAAPEVRRYKNHSVFQNGIASFNPLNIWDPIGAPIVGVGAIAGAGSGYPSVRSPVAILKYSFVGLGEEALFRGFLFPALSDGLGSKALGAMTSSLLFSWAHIVNEGSLSTGALIYRWIGGLVFCIQANRNQYDLRKNIFAHTWFDILVTDGQRVGSAQRSFWTGGVKFFF